MGNERFDGWVRSVGRCRSRRHVLRWLGTGLLIAAGPGRHAASAHHASAGPGDPCRSDNQCLGADVPLVCAWNGLNFDGTWNCCTDQGNRCGFDAACCGEAICVDGRCVDPAITPRLGCTGVGCQCAADESYWDNPCDPDLVCCVGESGQRMCLPRDTCFS
jgi:hypothetical protein